MTTASVYALERPDLGCVYVGETRRRLQERLEEHIRRNTGGLFLDGNPRVRVDSVVAAEDRSWAQLLVMRRYLRDGWKVVSDLGWADTHDRRVAGSREMQLRRSGNPEYPFGGRRSCTWSPQEAEERSRGFRKDMRWTAVVRHAEVEERALKRRPGENTRRPAGHGSYSPPAPPRLRIRCRTCGRESRTAPGSIVTCACGQRLRVPSMNLQRCPVCKRTLWTLPRRLHQCQCGRRVRGVDQR